MSMNYRLNHSRYLGSRADDPLDGGAAHDYTDPPVTQRPSSYSDRVEARRRLRRAFRKGKISAATFKALEKKLQNIKFTS